MTKKELFKALEPLRDTERTDTMGRYWYDCCTLQDTFKILESLTDTMMIGEPGFNEVYTAALAVLNAIDKTNALMHYFDDVDSDNAKGNINTYAAPFIDA